MPLLVGTESEFNIDQLKVKSLERLIVPLINQITSLGNPATFHTLKRTGKSGNVLVAAIEASIARFIDIGRKAIKDCPITKNNAVVDINTAIDDLEVYGKDAVSAGTEFVNGTFDSQKRVRAILAARVVLNQVVRILIMADMVDVYLMVVTIDKAKEALESVVTAESKHELSDRYSALCSHLDEISELTKRRLDDLRDPASQDDLQAIRAWLKMNQDMLYTSSVVAFYAYIRHPEVDQVRMNRDFSYHEMKKGLNALAFMLEGKPTDYEVALSKYGRIGDLVAELDQFQNRVETLEPSAYRENIHRPELENLLERIVSGSAAIADSENTRDERKKRIVDECNNLRQALQDLLSEYERNCGRIEPTEDLYLAVSHLGHKAKDLRRHLRRAIIDHISDAFIDTSTPLMILIESAKQRNQQATTANGQMFLDHSEKLVQAAYLACKMSTNEDNIRILCYAAVLLSKLSPQVVNAAHLLCARDSQVASNNMDAFREAWLEKVRLLTMAVDMIISLDDFLAVSESHIVEDVKIGIQSVIDGDSNMLDRTAGGIRGRSLRVCDVVDAEMDAMASDPYSERIKLAVKILRDEVVNEFAERAERVVNKLEKAAMENGEVEGDVHADVDEIIEASELVHNQVKEIRDALLMNRNPEDVDSDNEYVDESIGPEGSRISDSENQQNIMRQLPVEDKRKIQEQIDVFKITQNRFEREVAKWDETGNDIIVLAKYMCEIMMNMTDFTRGRGPLKTTMDVIKAAQDISDAGAKLNSLAKQIGDESVESETKKDLFAYLQRITLYCQQLNITSRVKADVQQVGNELVVSGLESAMSLIQTARNLLNAVVLTVKSAYIASTKYRRKNTAAPTLVEWRMAPPQKKPLVRPQEKPHGIVRRASEKRPLAPMKALSEFHFAH
uniref:Catenin alpha n=1 Tax=Syphacia muris TaxID=451379 RepID=A0A0N5AZ37_9BILA